MKKIAFFFSAILLFSLSLTALLASQPRENIEGKFAFYGYRDGSVGSAAYILDLKDNSLVLLGKGLMPVLSPDGNMVACQNGRDIFLYDAKGTLLKKMNLNTVMGQMGWSPDGKKLLYGTMVEEESKWKGLMWEYDLKLNATRILMQLDAGDNFINLGYSPDGKKILYQVSYLAYDDKDGDGLYISDNTGANAKRLGPAVICDNMWFPDSKHIAFWTNTDEHGDQVNNKLGAVYKLNIETGEKTKIRDMDLLLLKGFKLSRDGKYFYLSRTCRGGGQHIVLWPLDKPGVEIPVTHCFKIPNSNRYSSDEYPDWYQGK